MTLRSLAWLGLFLLPLSAFSGEKDTFPIRFRETTKEAGLLEPLAGIMGHGGAWGDYDGDGKVDLFVGGFCDRPNAEYAPSAGPVPSRLFRNLGTGKFELVGKTPVSFFGRTSGAVFADLDNSGRLALYAANNARLGSKKSEEPQRSAQNRLSNLFRFDGKSFADASSGGACPPALRSARNIGVLDYDGDGLLDLLVVEDVFIKKPSTRLFRNQGKFQFEDVTRKVGLPEDLYGLGLAVADLNGDGRPDFFVPHSNRFFLSKGDGTYHEPAELKQFFAWKPLSREDWPCGAVFGDLNRDGQLDLVLTIHGVPARNKVYLNLGLKNGIPQFRDITKEAGLADPVPVRCPHVEIQDLDNDGWPDIYISAGWKDEKGAVTPLIFHHTGLNDGIPRFMPPRPIGGAMVYWPAGPTADYDGDGRVDIFLINWFKDNHSRLLHNESAKHHWLNVRVEPKKGNRMGIGAQVSVYRAGQLGQAAGLLGFGEITTGYGYASGQPALSHFGLGKEATVDVAVRLPDGRRVERRGVKSDQTLVIAE